LTPWGGREKFNCPSEAAWGAAHDSCEEQGGDVLCPLLLEGEAAVDVEESGAECGVRGQERAELGELAGVTAVLEGVHVAGRSAGAALLRRRWAGDCRAGAYVFFEVICHYTTSTS
jgi:hypothetical protein